MEKVKGTISKIGIVLFLIFLLVISYNYKNIRIYSGVFAAITDQSSTNSDEQTDQSSTNNNADMVELMARVINGEARGEPYEGQVAVGAVIMNRVSSSEFPNTISGVIYQANQFSCVIDGQINKSIDSASTAYKAAREAINGSDPTGGALFFYNAKTAKSSWLYTRKVVAVIGDHTFAI